MCENMHVCGTKYKKWVLKSIESYWNACLKSITPPGYGAPNHFTECIYSLDLAGIPF